MRPIASAEIIAVGSELLTPSRLDTNSLAITERLRGLGIALRAKAVVGDRASDLAAVFLTDRNESTLKRVYREGKRLKLKPENPTMKPFYVDARNAMVLGKVMCVIRQT